MRFLFLDIDGPLNTGRNDYLDTDRYGHHFDDVAVRNLRWIVEETGARIVVSSSWRRGSGRVFGCRGEEIWQWLAENADTDDAYVIIDDMGDKEALEEQKTCWIRINPHTGISFDDATKAIAKLMR